MMIDKLHESVYVNDYLKSTTEKNKQWVREFVHVNNDSSYLEEPTVLSWMPLHPASWLYLSRSLTYLLQSWQSSVRFPHTSYKVWITNWN